MTGWQVCYVACLEGTGPEPAGVWWASALSPQPMMKGLKAQEGVDQRIETAQGQPDMLDGRAYSARVRAEVGSDADDACECEDQADEHVVGLGELAAVEVLVGHQQPQQAGAQQPEGFIGLCIGAVAVPQNLDEGNDAKDQEPDKVVAGPMRERHRQHLRLWVGH